MEVETCIQTIYSWKIHKQRVKIYKLGAMNGYIWNFMIYISKYDLTASVGHTQTVLLDLTAVLLTVIGDHYLATMSLAESLFRSDTYVIRILRSNCAGLEHEVVQKKLKCGEVYAHSAVFADTKRTNEVTSCPRLQQGKRGIDLSDQLSTYYTACLSQVTHSSIFQLRSTITETTNG